jgi:hypothetical protein
MEVADSREKASIHLGLACRVSSPRCEKAKDEGLIARCHIAMIRAVYVMGARCEAGPC